MTRCKAIIASVIDLQAATLRDLRAIYQLERAIFPKDAYPYIDLVLLLAMPWVSNTKVMSDDGRTIGFLSVANPLLPRRPAWIITIGVAEHAQGRGIGTRLMQLAESVCHSDRLKLTVRRSNYAAIELYNKMGYTVLRRFVRYYRDGEDGLIMQKVLS